jgi:hypothetical protein
MIPSFKEFLLLGEDYLSHFSAKNKLGAKFNPDIHHHPDVKPANLTAAHKEALTRYAGDSSIGSHDSSRNINALLRSKAGDTTQKLHHSVSEKDVEEAANKLASAFTKENTNKKELTVHFGVPPHIGEKFKKSEPGSEHQLHGFTSSSTVKETAESFANMHAKIAKGKTAHIVKATLKPHTGMSVVDFSPRSENEILINKGQKAQYVKSTKSGNTVTHHVIITPRSETE